MTISKAHQPYLALNSKIGTQVLFFIPANSDDQVFQFSTTLDKIGYDLDAELKNRTRVVIISDPVDVKRKQYGVMSVTKVRTRMDKELWLPTNTLVDIEDEGKIPVVH